MSLKQYSKLGMQYRFAEYTQMGDALYSTIAPANNDEGRAHQRTVDDPAKQVNNAFDQNTQQLRIDGYNETNQIPTGGWQSKAAVDYAALAASSPIPVKGDERAKRHGGGFYTKEMIGIDPDKLDINVLAHELGHAKNNESLLGRMSQHPIARAAHALSPLIGFGLGPLVKGTGTNRALKVLAMTLGVAGPALAGEASASYKGYQLLKEHGATDQELNAYVKSLIKPQSTYLTRPAIAGTLMHLNKGAASKLDARCKFNNLLISIETDKGNYRHWHDPHTGEAGKTKMQYPYGYIRKTEGLDGDHVDCFVGPNEKASMVYVVTTNKSPDFKTIDEQKCMLGFDSAEKAKEAFMASYTDKRFFNKMTAMPYDEFERKVLATADGPKKIALDKSLSPLSTDQTTQGTFNDQVPGDYLGYPAGSLVGMRTVIGDPLTPVDKIDKSFRFNDLNMNTTNVDPAASAVPSSPGV